MYKHILASIFLVLIIHTNGNSIHVVTSPDGKIQVHINDQDQLSYFVFMNERVLLTESVIGLELSGNIFLGKKPQLIDTNYRSINQILKPSYGIQNEITDVYNEVELFFEGNYSVIFRVYDDGFAYRFITQIDSAIVIKNETASFMFSDNHTVYYPQVESFFNPFERNYLPMKFSEIPENTMGLTPTLVSSGGFPPILITEADLRDYPGMYLKNVSSPENYGFAGAFPPYPLSQHQEILGRIGLTKRAFLSTLKVTSAADYIAKTNGTRQFPWRVLIIGDETNLPVSQMVYKLSTPCLLDDVSWIKPGKVAWDWYNAWNLENVDFKAGVNTKTYEYYIDFAAQNGLEYVNLDEGWSDNKNLFKLKKNIDLHHLIDYAHKKNVGVFIWMMWDPLRNDLTAHLDSFAAWGVDGLKIDFFDRDDQYIVHFVEELAREAGNRHLLLNLHGIYKPTGLYRTYPNIINSEGVLGLEYNKFSNKCTPVHNVTIPYIRMAVGGMDYTPGSMYHVLPKDFKKDFGHPVSMTTRSHQMGMYAVYYGALQMLPEAPTTYQKEPELLNFIKEIPATWDESKVLEGKLGEYIVMARRKGEDWYVGGMTGQYDQFVRLSVSFLDADKNYTAEWIADTMESMTNPAKYIQSQQTDVANGQSLDFYMVPSGGFLLRLSPEK